MLNLYSNLHIFDQIPRDVARKSSWYIDSHLYPQFCSWQTIITRPKTCIQNWHGGYDDTVSQETSPRWRTPFGCAIRLILGYLKLVKQCDLQMERDGKTHISFVEELFIYQSGELWLLVAINLSPSTNEPFSIFPMHFSTNQSIIFHPSYGEHSD